MTQMGTYTKLLSSSPSFAHLLEDIHQQGQESITNIQKQQSIISSTYSEEDNDEEFTTNMDTKEEGSIRWNVYISYIKAGFGCAFGFIFLALIFIAHQVTTMYSSWWLATWSDDENHRYRNFNNCASEIPKDVKKLRLMTDNEWNTYRDQRFYIYCGEFDDNRNENKF